jgi:hypothetical protein
MNVEQLVEGELTGETENSAKTTIVTLCSPQISHHMIWDRTGAVAVGTPAPNRQTYVTTIYVRINAVISS